MKPSFLAPRSLANAGRRRRWLLLLFGTLTLWPTSLLLSIGGRSRIGLLLSAALALAFGLLGLSFFGRLILSFALRSIGLGRLVLFLSLLCIVVSFLFLGCLGVDLELGLILYHVITGTREMDGRIVGLSGFFDGITPFGLDGYLALALLLGYLATWLSPIPVPGG